MNDYNNLTKAELIGVLKDRDALIAFMEIDIAKCQDMVAGLRVFQKALDNIPFIIEKYPTKPEEINNDRPL
ncbi:MAG TPA: hypothetical protein ENH82_13185 [bacterium]|nr:hypothetical protein [bacterium]